MWGVMISTIENSDLQNLQSANFEAVKDVKNNEFFSTICEAFATGDVLLNLDEIRPLLLNSRKWERLRILIENGVWKPSESTFFGKLLLLLVKKSQFKLASILAGKDASIDFSCTTIKKRQSLLHLSIKKTAPLALINLFIQKGCDINAKNSKRETPLIVAVSLDKAKMVALLVKAGADLSIKCRYNFTAVAIAAIHRSYSCLEAILNNAANAENDNAQFGHALWFLIRDKAYSIAIKTLRLRRVIAFFSYYNYLTKAISRNTPLELIALLIEGRAPKYKKSMLKNAIGHDREDIVSLLLQNRNLLPIFKLHKCVEFAAKSNKFSCLEAILDNAPFAMQERDERTSAGKALLELLLCSEFPIARKILKTWKPIVSCQTAERSQPLHVAVMWKAPLDIIAMIVKSGGDIFAKDMNDNTPMSIAKKRGFHFIVNTLENPDINIINARAMLEFMHLHSLGHWSISALPIEILYYIAGFLLEKECINEVLNQAKINCEWTLKEWWQTRTVSIDNKQKYYWHLIQEYGNVPRAIEVALNLLEGVEKLDFPSIIDNFRYGSDEKRLFRNQQILNLARLLIYRKYPSPLAYYLRGVYGTNAESYLKIAAVLDDQKDVWKLTLRQRNHLELYLATITIDKEFSDML